MSNIIQRIVDWFRAKFFSNKAEKPKRKYNRKSKEHMGSHYYLSDLLDQMPDAFLGLELLRKVAPETHKLFSKTGCAVASKDMTLSVGKTGYIDYKNAPSFGCAHMIHTKVQEDVELKGGCFPIVCYFSKVKRPYNVQPTNKATYEFGFVFDTRHLSGCPLAVLERIYLSVDEDGTYTALKMCQPKPMKVGRSSFVRMTWEYPQLLENYAEQWGDTDIEGVAEWWFNLITHMSMSTESGLTVRIKKKKSVVSFAIDMERTPYFFSDREKTVNVNGKTKKIFHIVRGHTRTMADGTEKYIKPHFRGLRKFLWNDYQVSISLTGKHHKSMFDYSASAELLATTAERDAVVASGKFMDQEKLGKVMEKHYENV